MSASAEVLRDVAGLTGIGVLVKGIQSSVASVKENEYALRTHAHRPRRRKNALIGRGKAGDLYGKVGPGNYLALGLRGYSIVSTRDRNLDLEDFTVGRVEDQHGVRSRVTWGVINNPKDDGEILYKALFNADSPETLEAAVKSICTSGLQQIYAGMKESGQSVDQASAETVGDNLKTACEEELVASYGVELRRFYLIEAAGTVVTAVALNGQLSAGGAVVGGGFMEDEDRQRPFQIYAGARQS